VQSIWDGARHAAQGDVGRGITTALPNGLRGAVEMVRKQGRFEDPNGNLLFEGTTPEIIMRGIGFRPSRLSELQRTRRISTMLDESTDRKRRQELDAIGELLLAGDLKNAQAALLGYLDQNKENPAINAQQTINHVVNRTIEKALPLDPLRTGSTATVKERSRIAELFGAPQRVSEEQQLFLKRRLKQQLSGRAEPLDFNQIRRARRIDQFISQNPTITYQEARARLGQ
jgi:hypothetical protein